jgi:hypothetical protein
MNARSTARSTVVVVAMLGMRSSLRAWRSVDPQREAGGDCVKVGVLVQERDLVTQRHGCNQAVDQASDGSAALYRVG